MQAKEKKLEKVGKKKKKKEKKTGDVVFLEVSKFYFY